MTETIPDLWPEEIKVDVQSPAAIFRRQASQLQIRTKDSLEGEVKIALSPDRKIMYDFRIVAPALDGYKHSLFMAKHDETMVYPVIIWFKPWVDAAKTEFKRKYRSIGLQAAIEATVTPPEPDGAREAATPKDLLELLKELLNAPYTKGIIMSLLARVNETGTEEALLPPAPPKGQ
jgi:hypothetical protein